MPRSIVLAALAITTLVLSFAAQWYVLRQLGAGDATDALFASLAVPQFLLMVLSNPYVNAAMPMLAIMPGHERREVGGALTLGTLIAFGLVALVLAPTVPFWGRVIMPGLGPVSWSLYVGLTWVHLAGSVLIATAGGMRATANAADAFVWPATAAAIGAACGLVVVIAGIPHLGVWAAAWGYLLRAVIEGLLLVPAIRFTSWRRHAAQLKKIERSARPLVVGSLYDRTDVVVDRMLASLAPAGQLSLFYFAQQVFGAAAQVMNRAVTFPATPRLSVSAAALSWAQFRAEVRRSLAWVGGLAALGVVSVALVGQPMLQLLLAGPSVAATDIHLLWVLLLLLSALPFGDPAGHLLSTAHYAMGETRRPTWLAATAFTIGMGLKVAGFAMFGILGLAVATSAYWVLRPALLVWGLNRILVLRERRGV